MLLSISTSSGAVVFRIIVRSWLELYALSDVLARGSRRGVSLQGICKVRLAVFLSRTLGRSAESPQTGLWQGGLCEGWRGLRRTSKRMNSIQTSYTVISRFVLLYSTDGALILANLPQSLRTTRPHAWNAREDLPSRSLFPGTISRFPGTMVPASHDPHRRSREVHFGNRARDIKIGRSGEGREEEEGNENRLRKREQRMLGARRLKKGLKWSDLRIRFWCKRC